jgi:putative tricarboxylic transport membrane protein
VPSSLLSSMPDTSRLPALLGLGIIALLGATAAVIAFRLGLWRQGSPGEGLFPFMVASAVVVFSVASMPLRVADGPDGERPNILRVGAYLGALIFYATTLEALGFVAATAIMIVFILRAAERYSWRMVAALTVGTIAFCHVLFVRWLGAQLPVGALWDGLL